MPSAMNKGINFGIQGGLIPGIAGWLSGDDTNPADEANKYLDQIPDSIKPYLEPYMNAGKNQLGPYQDIINKLLTNPNELLSQFGKGYQESPGYKWNLQQGESAINNANAAGGMLGTPQHQQQAGQLANNLASQDFDKYMQHMMNLFGGGLSGASGLIQGGQKAGGSLADAIAQVLGQKGQYAYAGQAGENAATSRMWENLFGGAGSAASFFH